MKKNKVIAVTILLILTLSSSAFASVTLSDNIVKSYLVGDYETGQIIEGHNVDIPVEIASVSKIMTYLLVMDRVEEGDISLEDRVTIREESARIGGSSLKLKTGEILTVQELLEGLLIVSANDGAHALATYTYGSEDKFARQMNKKAQELGLKTAKFYNCSGLPKGELQNKMSPREIFELTRHIINKYPQVMDITSKRNLIMKERDFNQPNTNDLLRNTPGVDGFKTGYTDKAGYCLVSTLSSKQSGLDCRLISVVMGAKTVKNRTLASKKLYNHIKHTYRKQNLLDVEKPVEIIKMPKTPDGYIKIYPEKNYSEIVRSNEVLDMQVRLDRNLKPSFTKGQKVGVLDIYRNGEIVDKVNVLVKENIDKQNFFRRTINKVKKFLSKIIDRKIVGAV